jgi:hypothetical protein
MKPEGSAGKLSTSNLPSHTDEERCGEHSRFTTLEPETRVQERARTAGLLGGAYVGITPGAASAYLRSGSNMEMTESAFSLEHLMKGLSSLPGLQPH